ncbi:CRISPR-associated endonuclease Cas1 [Desulfonatronovibrio hydrogenovorans]|uniref:CRISPR-associated endonuclease Cas1 n=1 Tax=Desulfonatronovibrio hydrogenovorans TaxID=53245 RepID=UPI00048BD4D8|nr:CRISPR-associated endonuclease Cas1 [Desulfonatronovibrio hydrogenovorans]
MQRTYVLEYGTYLRKVSDSLELRKKDKVLCQIPLNGLKQLTLVGGVSLSSPVMDLLARNRIETIILGRNWDFKARFMVDEHKHVARRMAQYYKMGNPDFALRAARVLVRSKLENASSFLSIRGRNYQDEELHAAGAKISSLAEALESRKSIEQVRAVEGQASKVYFAMFPRLLRNKSFSFNGRNRRPPLDPVNAMLSYVYTMLIMETLTMITAAGLDPYLGSLHALERGRPSLACDLVEEWRTFLGDRMVLGLINRRQLKKSDFTIRSANQPGKYQKEDRSLPVEMKKHATRKLIDRYEKWMATRAICPVTSEETDYRGLMRRRIWKFCRWIEGRERSFEPGLWFVEK